MNQDLLLNLITESLKKDSKKSRKSTSKRKPNHFNSVNSKYEPLLINYQSISSDSSWEIKRKVIEECINRVSQINRKEYLAKLRDTMMEFVLNLNFLLECRDLGIDAFATAQNMIILNKHRKALISGIKETYAENFDLLKEPLFTEAELADAKFSGVEGLATKAQRTQLSILIERSMTLLPSTEIEAEADVNVLE